MKIVGISDIHGHLPELPSCDVVCICGDILPLNIQRNYDASWQWLSGDFTNWANNLNCNHVIFIAGNHDFIFDESRHLGIDVGKIWKNSNKIHYLQDTAIEIEGKLFYGTPWIPNLVRWAFYLDSDRLVDKFKAIPNCDVLITHCPPKIGNAGRVLQPGYNYGRDFGCEELRVALNDLCVKWLLCGHIHSGDHKITEYKNTNIVNVSINDEDYEITYKPFEFEL